MLVEVVVVVVMIMLGEGGKEKDEAEEQHTAGFVPHPPNIFERARFQCA